MNSKIYTTDLNVPEYLEDKQYFEEEINDLISKNISSGKSNNSLKIVISYKYYFLIALILIIVCLLLIVLYPKQN